MACSRFPGGSTAGREAATTYRAAPSSQVSDCADELPAAGDGRSHREILHALTADTPDVSGRDENVVGIAERRIEPAARRASADRDRVAPGAAAGSASDANPWTCRIVLRGDRVVVSRVPIGTPFVHVRRDAVEAERVRLAER